LSVYQETGAWPKGLRNAKVEDGNRVVDEKVGYVLADKGVMPLEIDSKTSRTKGLDKFGVITPYATAVLKRLGSKANESSKVTGSSTIADHRLRFELDLDGDGLIENVNVGGESISVRANVMVWCSGRDGKILPYTKGIRSDDVHSWTRGQVVK
jgi:hypothetical protein